MEILKFNPIYKPTLWGSETWVVSAVKGSESVVVGGEDKGLTLPQVVPNGTERWARTRCGMWWMPTEAANS